MSPHRLLPSIVFASTSLLTGCGGQVDAATSFPEAPIPGPPDEVQLPPRPDAAPKAKPDAAVPDATPDARTCEGGWPTTKGQICTFDAGISCCTSSWDKDSGTLCCDVGEGH